MTYSVVARCPDTGQLGIGVASHVLSVGRVAPFVAPEVGAVATQGLVQMAHGPRILDLLREGAAADDALATSLAADDGAALRQVAVVDARGRAAAHTGEGSIPAAGHVVGDGWSAQSNIAVSPAVWEAMGASMEGTAGRPLAVRLVAALDAAEAEGGDLRGRQSAAVAVASGSPTGDLLVDRPVDVRVDDHSRPLDELRRLVDLALAADTLDRAEQALARGDVEAARDLYAEAVQAHPERAEYRFWQAVSLAVAGEVDEARRVLAGITADADGDRWRELVARVGRSGVVDAEHLDVLVG
jgi:uncharacterized Ntn-hydrolase superfamily protein